MRYRGIFRGLSLSRVIFIGLLLVVGCGEDSDPPTGPPDPPKACRWETLMTSLTEHSISDLDFFGEGKAIATSGSGTIILTMDGGSTWDARDIGTDAPLTSVSCPDRDTGFVVGGGGTILRTIDRGDNWSLLDSGVTPGDIAVIATYAAQVRLLRERLSVPGLEIDSVDGFQGREKEVVVISLVRSNAQAEIGFLQETRRMNVAMTRARRKLLVVGDSATLCAHPFYRRMIDAFEALGAYRTVWEEDDML